MFCRVDYGIVDFLKTYLVLCKRLYKHIAYVLLHVSPVASDVVTFGKP